VPAPFSGISFFFSVSYYGLPFVLFLGAAAAAVARTSGDDPNAVARVRTDLDAALVKEEIRVGAFGDSAAHAGYAQLYASIHLYVG